jgi:DNA polymerase III alpha subunit (gram-positive type)
MQENKELKDVVSFREDMLEFLGKNNVNPDDAFKFAELVRKGNQKNKAEEFNQLCDTIRKNNIPE